MRVKAAVITIHCSTLEPFLHVAEEIGLLSRIDKYYII